MLPHMGTTCEPIYGFWAGISHLCLLHNEVLPDLLGMIWVICQGLDLPALNTSCTSGGKKLSCAAKSRYKASGPHRPELYGQAQAQKPLLCCA